MTFVAAPAALTTTEQSELELCEQTITHLRQAFADAGAALSRARLEAATSAHGRVAASANIQGRQRSWGDRRFFV
jgi:hypothetical protein